MPPPLATATAAGTLPSRQLLLSGEGGGDFFDNYNNFVSNLNFCVGSWDGSSGPVKSSLLGLYDHGGSSGYIGGGCDHGGGGQGSGGRS